MAILLVAGRASGLEAIDSDTLIETDATLNKLEMQIGNLENRLGVSRSTINGIVARARYFPTERRILDADLFFETGHFDKSATLYRDLIDQSGFRNAPGYFTVLFKLGESLFRLRNYITARRYFERAAKPDAGPHFDPSIARLFEIAVRTRDFTKCERFESLILAGTIASPDVLYAYGKYLYHKGERNRVQAILSRVSIGTDHYARARYFLGVLAASSDRPEEALAFFQSAVDQEPVSDRDIHVYGLALLAKSRIYFQTQKYDDALAVIQMLEVTNPVFPQSLFDAAWIHLKLEDLPAAAHALDIMLMTVESGDLALKGGALRGRILTRLNDTEAAAEAYEEVSESIGPVATELDRVSDDPNELVAYFDWIIRKDSTAFQMDVPISDKTVKWLEAHPDMKSIIRMFGDLSTEKNDLQEALGTADKLLWSLKSGGEFIAFPVLKENLLRLKEIESGFLTGALRAVDSTAALLHGRTSGDEGVRYRAAVRARVGLQRHFKERPREYKEYLSRERRVSSKYSDVDRELFLIKSFLEVERRQVVAIEEWIVKTRLEGNEQLTPEREARLKAALNKEKRLLKSLHAEMIRLKASIEKESLKVESQVDMIKDDDALRGKLLKALRTEIAAQRRVNVDGDPGLKRVVEKAVLLVERSAAGIDSIRPLTSRVMNVAKRGAGEFEAAVKREKQRLEDAVKQLQKAELDSQAFARSQGVLVFQAVLGKLREVLLEADLGLVDMAWQREQKVSGNLRDLGKRKSDRMRSLVEMENLLKEDGKAELQNKEEGGEGDGASSD